jgi:hypothetical protein
VLARLRDAPRRRCGAHQFEYKSKTAAVLSVAALARGGSAPAPFGTGSFSRSLSRLRGRDGRRQASGQHRQGWP